VLKKKLESGAHGAALSKGERPYDQVGGDRRLRDRDYAARPLATGRIRAVILVCFPQPEGESTHGLNPDRLTTVLSLD